MTAKAAKPTQRKPAKKPAERRELTPQQKLFVLEYMKDLNATQAAIRAGYSQRTAHVIAHELLKKPLVAEAIEKAMAEREDRTKIDADFVLKRLFDEVEADLADIYNDDGTLRPIKEWPMIWRKGLVAGLEVEVRNLAGEEVEESQEPQPQGGSLKRAKAGEAVVLIHKIKISDRSKRMEMLGKHVRVNAFREKVLHDLSDPFAKFLADVSGKSIRPAEEAGDG